MKTALKRAAIVLGAVIALAMVGVIVLSFLGRSRLGRLYPIDAAAIPVPTDSAAIARGRHVAEAVTFCTACHGDGLEGDVLFEAPGIATLYAPNLTGGRGAVYEDTDRVRAIRHGVSREGRRLMIMHSDAYNRLGTGGLGRGWRLVGRPVGRDDPDRYDSLREGAGQRPHAMGQVRPDDRRGAAGHPGLSALGRGRVIRARGWPRSSDGHLVTIRGSISARRSQYASPSLGSGKISSAMSRMRS